jgi:HK97 family phage portal protein
MAAPLLARARAALSVLRGETPQDRAILPAPFPSGANSAGFPGAQLVRTANPQEFKPEGAAVRVQGFNKHPVVHACVRVVADIVASVPLVVLRERGNSESRVPEAHPLQQLLDYPNARMSARQFRARYAVDFLGYGNSFFQLQRPAPGRAPLALRAVNAESIQSVWVDAEGDPARYDYGNWSGLIVQSPAEDMLHFRDLDMPRPFTPDVFGFPRGATALASMAADNEATHYVRQVVTNDGTPTFAVLLSDEATQDDAVAMQERYRERVVNRGKRGSPAFFGAVRDIKPLGFTLSDLEFPDLRRVSREDICAAFGVDPRMIGIASATSDAGLSGAQYAEARARLVQHTIEPMLAAIEDELNHWLAPEFGDVWICYDHDVLRDLIEDDKETSERVRAEFAASLRTWEESRTALHLPPLPVPTDALLLPSSAKLVPAALAVIDPRAVMDAPDAVAPAAPALPVDALDDEDEDNGEDDADGEDDGRRAPADAVRTEQAAAEPAPMPDARGWWERLTPDELEAEPRYQYWKRSMDELTQREIRWYRTAMDRFGIEREQVGALFGVDTRAYRTKAEILAEIERRIREGYRPGGEYYEAWREAYDALVGELYMVGARQVGGVGLSFSLQSPEVLQAIANRTGRLAELIGETTAQQVTAAIRAAQLGGLSVAETGRLIQASVYGEAMTDNRATMIARTESAGAMSQGSWDQAQEMGDLYRAKEWLAFEDGKTRETHTACMAQGILAIDAPFSNGLAYPLDPAGEAAEVINCRCVLAYYDQTVEELTA